MERTDVGLVRPPLGRGHVFQRCAYRAGEHRGSTPSVLARPIRTARNYWIRTTVLASMISPAVTRRRFGRVGIAATDFQSTAASRPRRPAASWLTSVE